MVGAPACSVALDEPVGSGFDAAPAVVGDGGFAVGFGAVHVQKYLRAQMGPMPAAMLFSSVRSRPQATHTP